jgi:hypothetical protein
MCLSAVAPFEAAEDDEAAEPLLPDEDEPPPLPGADAFPDDLEDESTDDDTRRDDERVERGPQLEMKPRADAEEVLMAEAAAESAGAVLLCVPSCLSSERA